MAGRPDKPVDRTVPALAKLAEHLRTLKRRACLTYGEMELIARTGERFAPYPVSAATLKRAASGKTLPAVTTVQVYVVATTGHLDVLDVQPLVSEVSYLHERARRAVRARYHLYRAPDPQLVSTMADMSRALRDLHVWAGSPSARAMEERAGQHNVLPHTTANRILQGRTVPVDEPQFTGFLRACDVEAEEHELWLDAWHRAEKTYLRLRQRRALSRALAGIDVEPAALHSVA
ncbi:XRE family transcriptional regulator [Streptomyces sp. NPDC021020]|uniref:XRE family transcriptional regulator n=1 Tax=Streptomyces sp. NPDC021020 TaxID=3365109 RepID=UPI0037B15112